MREPADALVGLAARDFDLVVDEEYPGAPAVVDDQLDRQPAFDDPLQLVVPTEWGVVDDITDLADRHWVLEPSGTPARTWSETFCRERGFEPDGRFSFDDLMMRLRLVEAGLAAALLPGLAPDGDPRRVAVLALPGDPVRRISTVVRQGAADHPALVAVREALSVATVTW